MLAAGLLLLEIACGKYDGDDRLVERALKIDDDHFFRAQELLELQNKIRKALRGGAGGPDLVLALPRALGVESGGELPHITTDHCHIAIITSVNCVKLRFCDFCWSDFTA